MPASTLNVIQERTRQRLNSDSNFLRRMLYFFELRIPAEVGFLGESTFLFPLILPPENYTLEEPFTLESTPTQGGGLYIEENGIVQRMIRLRGHTGFKPRNLNLAANVGPVPAALPPDKKSFSRELPTQTVGALSGHRHFQYLQDSVFRVYGDLKRDPVYSKDTSMIFHNVRDSEHWVVAPQKFTLERSSSAPVLYRYSIDLLVVDKAEERKADFSEDKNIIDQLKDSLRTIKSSVNLATGALNDLTALVGEIRLLINDIVTILDTANSIVTATNNYLNGATELIELPYSQILGSIANFDAGGTTVSRFDYVPPEVEQKFRQVAQGFSQIAIYPDAFENTTDALMRELRAEQEPRRRLTQEQKDEILAEDTPTTFDAVRNLGTKPTPGDIISSEGSINVAGAIQKYKSVKKVAVNIGDTLMSLAAKYLGDARLWEHIAVVNGLKPPFLDTQASAPLVNATSLGSAVSGKSSGIDETPFSNSLGVGSQILIPTNQRPPKDMPLLPILGVQKEEPVDNHFMGTDLKLEVIQGRYGSSRALYDVPIDTDLGSVDVQTVSGIDNISQSLVIRLITERNTDVMYKQLGLQRIVGSNMAAIDLEVARFRVLETLRNDARVGSVRNLVLEQAANPLDSLEIAADIEIRGLAQSRKLTAEV